MFCLLHLLFSFQKNPKKNRPNYVLIILTPTAFSTVTTVNLCPRRRFLWCCNIWGGIRGSVHIGSIFSTRVSSKGISRVSTSILDKVAMLSEVFSRRFPLLLSQGLLVVPSTSIAPFRPPQGCRGPQLASGHRSPVSLRDHPGVRFLRSPALSPHSAPRFAPLCVTGRLIKVNVESLAHLDLGPCSLISQSELGSLPPSLPLMDNDKYY